MNSKTDISILDTYKGLSTGIKRIILIAIIPFNIIVELWTNGNTVIVWSFGSIIYLTIVLIGLWIYNGFQKDKKSIQKD